MPSKTIAPHAYSASRSGQKTFNGLLVRSNTQRGVTLIELLVGIAIGLLTVAVATGALMVSRGVSGTVSDVSSIQQQAAYAMRVIGLQLRQAGSLRLNLNPGTASVAEPYMASVAFEAITPPASSPLEGFNPTTDTLSGTATPVTLTTGYRRYTEPVFTNATEQALSRNCLGGPADTSSDARLESIFQLTGSELQCNGNGAGAQAIVQNVANFQVNYLVQDSTSTPGDSKVKSVDASGVTNWGQVQAVEVCLVLYGAERIDLPSSAPANDPSTSYRDCNGTLIDMRTLAAPRKQRMHMAFRSTFQLRSQGLIGTVL